MKSSKSSGFSKPFADLKLLLERKAVLLKPAPTPGHNDAENSMAHHHNEQALFMEAMADVKKISKCKAVDKAPAVPRPSDSEEKVDHECLVRLNNLVKHGIGLIVSYTAEYVEGIGYCVNPDIARRLHRGDFSIQAHIDLHGLGVRDAREAFEQFLTESVSSGKRAVLIIHGRGLSSPIKPILKTNVYRWLTSSPWHKWVIAFTSARLCDGGAGATYVLLRQRPLTKRFRKKWLTCK